MRYLILLPLMLFIAGCKGGGGACPPGTIPNSSTSSSGTGTTGGTDTSTGTTGLFSVEGFSVVACEEGTAKPIYISISADGLSAFADINNTAFVLQTWTLTVTLIKDGKSLTITEHSKGPLPLCTDYVPVRLEAELVAKCTTDDPHLVLEFVNRGNNTFAEGTMTDPNGPTETVIAFPGLCLANGYIPAWQRECETATTLKKP